MRVLVTGAGGFVGQGLVAALQRPGALPRPVDELILADVAPVAVAGARCLAGDLGDPEYLAALTTQPLDLVFHLASVPGGLAERTPDLGWRVNLQAPQALAAALARQARAGGPVARLVFASSIAVLGPLGPDPVSEDHPPAPNLSYGAHKWMTEILLADLARRGEVDAVSLRLPGIVARPRGASGFGSAFMSELFHAALHAEALALPVAPGATAWWMARPTCVAALLHAAQLPGAALPGGALPGGAILLPALQAPISAILAALRDALGSAATAGITFAPDERIEALFGRLPPLSTPRAHAAGFRGDASPEDLVRRVLDGLAGQA